MIIIVIIIIIMPPSISSHSLHACLDLPTSLSVSLLAIATYSILSPSFRFPFFLDEIQIVRVLLARF